MAGAIKILDDNGYTLSIVPDAGASDREVSAEVLGNINIVNIVNGTLPTSDPLVVGRLWNNAGTITVSNG